MRPIILCGAIAATALLALAQPAFAISYVHAGAGECSALATDDYSFSSLPVGSNPVSGFGGGMGFTYVTSNSLAPFEHLIGNGVSAKPLINLGGLEIYAHNGSSLQCAQFKINQSANDAVAMSAFLSVNLTNGDNVKLSVPGVLFSTPGWFNVQTNYTSVLIKDVRLQADNPIAHVLPTYLDSGSDRANYFEIAAVERPVIAVPEPSTWALMLIGFSGLGFLFRNQRNSKRLRRLA